jgi:ubiquinone/menaquinone biosynthesis C-methylase UbiE/uncharacterized protein YbaR (Trm112 family)
MFPEILSLLKCPACESNKLFHKTFSKTERGEIEYGVVWCANCLAWYPVEAGLLEFLVGELAYPEDRKGFAKFHSIELIDSGLDPSKVEIIRPNHDLQIQQQLHFDWYAHNEEQSYSDYENTSFWLAADKIAFAPWRNRIQTGKWLLDIGCAQGRSTFKVMDLKISILGMDISKHLVRQAIERYRQGNYQAKATFIAADATSLPIVENVIDYVLIYGVLHHLPNPQKTCQEIARILVPGGEYFGSENNTSIFRKIFDLIQRHFPIWSEEAGPEALISKEFLEQAFQNTNMRIQTKTSIFLPPHLLNLTDAETAYKLLKFTDDIGQFLPVFKNNGGLLVINGKKRA